MKNVTQKVLRSSKRKVSIKRLLEALERKRVTFYPTFRGGKIKYKYVIEDVNSKQASRPIEPLFKPAKPVQSVTSKFFDLEGRKSRQQGIFAKMIGDDIAPNGRINNG